MGPLRVLLLLAFWATSDLVSCSFIPPTIFGDPLSMSVVTLDPPDFRGTPVYRIEFTTNTKAGLKNGMIHRNWEEFQELQRLITSELLIHSGLTLPVEPSVESLNDYLIQASESPNLMMSTIMSHFLGINWDGKDIKFFGSLVNFIEIVTKVVKAPYFQPEPPLYDSEDDVILAEETPFEVYLYLKGLQSQDSIEDYLIFFKNYTDTCPGFEGAPDDSDVQWPNSPVTYPPHYDQTYVHFLPGGYRNGKTLRINYVGKSKFNFLNETIIKEWLVKLHGDKNPAKVLDIGSGPGFSAMVLAEMFPEAQIYAVDMAAPNPRFSRRWAELRGLTNVEFYHANAEDMHFWEDNTFDFINYAYVLHEMPQDNSIRIINEIYRLLTPGGTMNGFEVPFPPEEVERSLLTEWNTWGYNWEDVGPKGPEPYMKEYEFGCNITYSLHDAGFQNISTIGYSFFDWVYLGEKAQL
ncbi:unnamed protein product [Meganyctiphanes norvegica]|uniref:Methyltransferase domain-containing protein n=1 Tax=Meganyctiphanes norvegica TaxID=48144 RepID=A0AAV2RVB2_MEGNR